MQSAFLFVGQSRFLSILTVFALILVPLSYLKLIQKCVDWKGSGGISIWCNNVQDSASVESTS